MTTAPVALDAARLAQLVAQCSVGTRRTLPSDIKRMSEWFGAEREERRSDYMNDVALRAAYVAFFVPQYAAKIAALLLRLQGEGHVQLPVAPRVLDVGAGPLTGTLGVWLLTGALGPSIALDLSMRSLNTGRGVLSAVCPRADVRLVEQSALHRVPDGPFDLIIVAHVLNEVGDPRRGIEQRVTMLHAMLNRLAPNGRIVVVEPATRVHGQALMRVRDALHDSGVPIHAPCVGATTCPLGGGGNSWCHADENWQPPPAFVALTEAAELRKDVLKHSYLVLGREPAQLHGLRLVGGNMRTTQGTLRYACGPQGLITLGEAKPLHRTVTEALRGALADGRVGLTALAGLARSRAGSDHDDGADARAPVPRDRSLGRGASTAGAPRDRADSDRADSDRAPRDPVPRDPGPRDRSPRAPLGRSPRQGGAHPKPTRPPRR